MSMSLQPHLVVLVLAAALMHAAWNGLAKGSGDKVAVFAVTQAVGTLAAAVVLPFLTPMAADAWPFMLASAVIHNGYFFFLMKAYQNGDLGHVYPLARGSAPLLVAGLGAAFAAETPTAGGLAGIVLISVGIASLAHTGRLAPGAARAAGLAFATALFIAAYTLIDGLGVRVSAAPITYAAWLFLLSGLPFCAITVAFRRHTLASDLKTAWRPGTVAGLLAALGYAIVLYAMSQGALAYVSALRETSVLFAALIGAIALKEPFGARRIAAAIVIAAGLIVLQTAG
jgi:drug/metabolite transporter (DMT)-like permease